MQVRRVAREQHATLAIGGRLSCHVGEPRHERRSVHPVVRPVRGEECVAKLLGCRLTGVVDVLLSQDDAVRPAAPLPIQGPIPPPSGRTPTSGSSSISTSAIIQLVEGSDPGKSIPAALRTTLRPPSQPTRYSARSGGSSDSSTWTPVSSCAKPVTSPPRSVGTPNPATQSARIGSKSRCHNARR